MSGASGAVFRLFFIGSHSFVHLVSRHPFCRYICIARVFNDSGGTLARVHVRAISMCGNHNLVS